MEPWSDSVLPLAFPGNEGPRPPEQDRGPIDLSLWRESNLGSFSHDANVLTNWYCPVTYKLLFSDGPVYPKPRLDHSSTTHSRNRM